VVRRRLGFPIGDRISWPNHPVGDRDSMVSCPVGAGELVVVLSSWSWMLT
jgi:hypothetical protein